MVKKEEPNQNEIMLDKLCAMFPGKMYRGSNPSKPVIETIPIPSVSLSDATHFWGIPLGVITQFYGPEGSGKTFMAMLCAAECQRKYPNSKVVWVDAEHSFNIEWAIKLGIDMERLIIIEEDNGGEMFAMLCGRNAAKVGGKGKPGIFDMVVQDMIDVKLVVIDSIAAIMPPIEATRQFEDQDIAALARFLPKVFRNLSSKSHKSNTAVLCINQARDKIGEMIPTLSFPGGRMYKHMLSMNIKFVASKAKAKTLYDDSGRKVGHKLYATVEKTRGGPADYKAEFWINFHKGIVNTTEELVLLGASYGVISRPTAQKYEFNGVEGTMDRFIRALDEQPSLQEEIVLRCKEAKKRGVSRSDSLSGDEAPDELTGEVLEEDDEDMFESEE